MYRSGAIRCLFLLSRLVVPQNGSGDMTQKKEKACIDCGKEITHKNPRCFSCINRKRWAVPGRKDRQRELMSDILRENSKRLWEEPQYLEQQSEWRKKANEVRWDADGAREAYSEYKRNYWADENNRDRQSRKMIEYWEAMGRGDTEYPSDFNGRLRERIRNRDGRRCTLCYKSEAEEGHRISVHHIDGCKNNNSWYNLISVCRTCHGKTHQHFQEFWERVLTYALQYAETCPRYQPIPL